MYNLQYTYVDENYPCMGIFGAGSFPVRSMYHHIKGKIPRQLVFGRDMVTPFAHVADCRYIRQCKQAQIDRDVIHKNFK